MFDVYPNCISDTAWISIIRGFELARQNRAAFGVPAGRASNNNLAAMRRREAHVVRFRF